MVNTQKSKRQLPFMVKKGFSETFIFLRLHSGKGKHSHPLELLDLTFLLLGLHSRKGKSTQHRKLLDSTIRVLLLKLCNDSDLHAHLLDLLGEACCSENGPRPLQGTNLLFSFAGIMILVSWEKSFKCNEVDYSKHLARTLLASSKGISSSP